MILKVCGLKYQRNIRSLEQLGPDWMGLIFYPRSPRYVSHTLKFDSENIKRIGVFVNASEEFVMDKINQYQLSGLQFHGDESVEYCANFIDSGQMIIKAFGVDEAFDFSRVEEFTEVCDYFLFDTKTHLRGGSGRTFHWDVLQHYHGPLPFLLSGGIGPESVHALKTFAHTKWFGIDINSKFETRPGYKNIRQIKRFKNAIFG